MDHKWLGSYEVIKDVSKGFFSLKSVESGKTIKRSKLLNGLFALTFASVIAMGDDPGRFEHERHLHSCLNKGIFFHISYKTCWSKSP